MVNEIIIDSVIFLILSSFFYHFSLLQTHFLPSNHWFIIDFWLSLGTSCTSMSKVFSKVFREYLKFPSDSTKFSFRSLNRTYKFPYSNCATCYDTISCIFLGDTIQKPVIQSKHVRTFWYPSWYGKSLGS